MIEDRTILAVDKVNLRFGGVDAIFDFSLKVQEGELLAVIGPNGAGKTCLLNCINGFYHPQSGDIYFEGKKITSLPTHKIARLGIGRVFQGTQLYAGLSTLENLMAARHIFMRSSPLAEALYFGTAHKEEIEHRRVVEEIIDFLEMEPIRKKIVAELPYGQRKRVDLGRALAMEPKLLLLDEPTAGMNLEEKEDIVRFILDIHEGAKFGYESDFLKRGVKTIVFVEHDMGIVMDIADRVVVLDFGKKIAEGLPEEIRVNREVIKAYLGEGGT